MQAWIGTSLGTSGSNGLRGTALPCTWLPRFCDHTPLVFLEDSRTTPTFAIFRHEPDIRSFKQGETIFKEGDPADCMFAVLEGDVQIELRSTVIEHIPPGGVFGEMALIDGLPRSATAVATVDCSLAAVNEKRFLRLVELTPRFALQMMQVITERLRRTSAS